MNTDLRLLLLFLISFLAAKVAFAPPPPPPSLSITEIMYNSPENADSLNFIEFTATGSWQNLSEAVFTGMNNEFPDSTITAWFGSIQILVVQDSVAFESVYGINALQWEVFSDLSLSTPITIQTGTYTETINLGSDTPSAAQANGSGHSIEKCYDNGIISFQPTMDNTGIEINGVTVFANPNEHNWPNCNPVGISKARVETGLKLYPNPNSGTFTLDFRQLKQNATVRIRNTLSQILFERQVNKGSTTLTQNIKFNKGIYLLELDDGNNCQHQYMVVTD